MIDNGVHVCLVVAVADNGVIGNDGHLPWRVPSDLKLFRRLTLGKPVIMGRKTYDSIGKPLEGRTNIILTRQRGFAAEGVEVVATVDNALKLASRDAQARGAAEIMVIGGAEIFAATLPLADRIYLTRIAASPAGDTFFPDLPADEWVEVRRERLTLQDVDDYSAELVVLERSGGRQSPRA